MRVVKFTAVLATVTAALQVASALVSGSGYLTAFFACSCALLAWHVVERDGRLRDVCAILKQLRVELEQ
jgi:hypothetical protein